MRVAVLVVVLAVVVGAWLRFHLLGELGFNGDEFWTLKWTDRSHMEMLSDFDTGLTMHLYLLLLKPWRALFGSSPEALKLPSMVFGTLLVPLVFWSGWRFLKLEAEGAALAALAVALSPALVSASRMARAYPLLAVVVLLSMGLFVRVLERPTTAGLAALAAVNTTLLAVSVLGAFVPLIEGLVLGLRVLVHRDIGRSAVARFLASFAISGLCTLAFYAAALPEMREVAARFRSPFFRPDALWAMFRISHEAPVVLLGLIVIGSLLLLRRRTASGQLLVLSVIVPPVLYTLQRTSLPDHALARYLLAYLPAHFCVASFGLFGLLRRSLPRRYLPAALIVLSAALTSSILFSPSTRSQLSRQGAPTSQALEFISGEAESGDLVTFDLSFLEFLLTLNRDLEIRSLGEQVSDPSPIEGRLLFVTLEMTEAMEWWRDRFHVEVISSPHALWKMSVLVSGPLRGNAEATDEHLEHLLMGFVTAAEQGARLSGIPHRHHRRLAIAHNLLKKLAGRAGDLEKQARHQELERQQLEAAASAAERVR